MPQRKRSAFTGRPERPITGDDPLAILARSLRRLRMRVGRPAYRTLAEQTHYSAPTLAEAAAGRVRPTWEVTEALARACGATELELTEFRQLWAEADRAVAALRARRGLAPRPVRATPTAGSLPDRGKETRRPTRPGEPRPVVGGDAVQFAWALRAVRAWAGQPGAKEIARRSGIRTAPSTMYDALRAGNSRFPSLEVTQAVVLACAPHAVDEWVDAWRAVQMIEFESKEQAAARSYPATSSGYHGQASLPVDASGS